jgi:hypothetical protein
MPVKDVPLKFAAADVEEVGGDLGVLDCGGLGGHFAGLKQPAKGFGSQAGCSNNHGHGVGIHGIMPGDGDDAGAIRHYNVLPLTSHMKTGYFKRPDRALMGYSRNCHKSTLENYFPFFRGAAQLLGY